MGKLHCVLFIALAGAAVILPFRAPACRAANAAEKVKAFYGKFDEIDQDKDGKISRNEWVQFQLKEALRRFDMGDTNHDGFISKGEAEAAAKQRKERIRKTIEQWQQEQEQKQGQKGQ